MALRVDEDRPAAAKAPEGTVEAACDGDQFGLDGGIEIRSAETRASLEAASRVEDASGRDERPPGQGIREPGRDATIFGEVYHGSPQTFRCR
ncbi:hypothetical protein NRB_09510 [Novosphingobium sp. 11B]